MAPAAISKLSTDLLQILSNLIQGEVESALRRKATLLLSELLNMANRLLPYTISSHLQVMPQLVQSVGFQPASTALPQINMIYQLDSVSRTLHRSQAAAKHPSGLTQQLKQQQSVQSQSMDSTKSDADTDMDEIKFRAAIVETQILSHVKYIKWNWDLIEELVNGPLKNPKRLSEAITGTKLLKRLLSFYRPFKYRFSDAPNAKPNQRYVRIGVSLMKTLLQNNEGIAYLSESKLLRQLGECLAQLDRVRLAAILMTMMQNTDLQKPDQWLDLIDTAFLFMAHLGDSDWWLFRTSRCLK